ncbi:MAG: hypothetical protein GXX85_14565, partial [Ignavibacteria bacterium]|nr:hypothetical protein [Ignavibacteria bacterium]
MRKTLICFIVIFIILPLTAQVKIKEKVEIKPEETDIEKLFHSSGSQNHTATFVLSWTTDYPDKAKPETIKFQAYLTNGNYLDSSKTKIVKSVLCTGYSGTITLSLSNLITGWLSGSASTHTFGAPGIRARCRLILDGEVIHETPDSVVAPYDIGHRINLPFREGIKMKLTDHYTRGKLFLSYDKKADIIIKEGEILNKPENVWNTNKESLNYNIIKGNDYCTLLNCVYDESAGVWVETDVGDYFTKKFTASGYIKVHNNEKYIGDEPFEVIVSSSVVGITAFDTLYIEACPLGYNINSEISRDIVFFEENTQIPIWVNYSKNCELVEFPKDLNFIAKVIEGQKYITLSTENGKLGDTLSGNDMSSLSVNVDNFAPDSVINAKIEITSNLPGTQGDVLNLKILPPQYEVKIEPASLSPGDTATVTVWERNESGKLEKMPSDQTFEAETYMGCSNAVILSQTGEEGNYLYGMNHPFYLTANDTVDSSSVFLQLKVGIIREGAACSVAENPELKDTNKPEMRILYVNKQQTTKNSRQETANENICSIAEFESSEIVFGDAVIDPCQIDSCGDDWKPVETITDANFV